MLSKETTLRSSISTYVTGKDIKSKLPDKKEKNKSPNEDIKLIFVKSKKNQRKHNNSEKVKPIKNDEGFETAAIFGEIKPILRNNLRFKSNRTLTMSSDHHNFSKKETIRVDKNVKFADQTDNRKKRKLAEITIVPSYAQFYHKVYVNDEENGPHSDKVHCKCGCIIF
jgi:hypothetical protein